MRKIWTVEEVELFKELYPTTEWKDLERVFGVNKDSLAHKAKQLGVVRKAKAEAKWTSKDIKYLEDNYGEVSLEKMMKHLGRTKSSVETKCKRLGLVSRTLWTDEEKELMKEYYPRFTNEALHNCLFPNRTITAIDGMGQRMGLLKNWIPWQKIKHFDSDDLIDRIIKLKESLGKVPTVEEIEKFGITSQKTIDRYFGGYRALCNTLGWEINYAPFGRENAIEYSKNKDICFSHAEKIITDFFIDNNISYKKEGSYKETFKISDFKTKMYDWLLEDNIVVEYFGFVGNKSYDQGLKKKLELCEKYNISLISLYEEDLINLERIFKKFK